MNNKKKLKVLVVVFFCFIIVLTGMLVYALNNYKSNKNPADTTSSTSSALSTVEQSQSTSNASQVNETIDLKLYFYDADDYDNVKEIRTVKVDKKLYQDDISSAINTLLSDTGLKINKVTVNGNSMVIDLPKDIALKFNSGSANGITLTNILAMTILNLPNVEQMEVTVDGQSGIEADHFNFNGVFKKSADGKKYDFTASDKPSKEINF